MTTTNWKMQAHMDTKTCTSKQYCAGHTCAKFSQLLLFSRSVVSNTFRPHGLRHTRPPCPSPSPELAQIHVHRVGDAIQSSHPLSSPSLPALNLSQHQGLFKYEKYHDTFIMIKSIMILFQVSCLQPVDNWERQIIYSKQDSVIIEFRFNYFYWGIVDGTILYILGVQHSDS